MCPCPFPLTHLLPLSYWRGEAMEQQKPESSKRKADDPEPIDHAAREALIKKLLQVPGRLIYISYISR